METVKKCLLAKYFSRVGYIVSFSHLVTLVSLSPYTGHLRSKERLRFSCRSDTHLRNYCLVRYDEQYTPILSLLGFVWLCFLPSVVVCIVYSRCCMKSRVDELETALEVNPENPRRRPRTRSRRVFCCYIIHLSIRFLWGTVFANVQMLEFYPAGFPKEFACVTPTVKPTVNSNATKDYSAVIINCDNSIASDMMFAARIILAVNVSLTVVVFGEMCYLSVRAFLSIKFTWDSEFCRKHLWNEKTHTITLLQAISIMKKDTLRKTETKFADLSSEDREEVKTLLRRNTNTQNLCKILVVGCSRKGNSLLCQKISHAWAKNSLRDFDLLYLFSFKWFNKGNSEKISLKKMLGFLHPDGSNDELFQYVLDNSEKVIIVFDGLDTYKNHFQCKENDQPYGENEAVAEMPLSALYVKLVTGKLLLEATVLTTSEFNAVQSIKHLDGFYRREEIPGVEDQPESEGSSSEVFEARSSGERDNLISCLEVGGDLPSGVEQFSLLPETSV